MRRLSRSTWEVKAMTKSLELNDWPVRRFLIVVSVLFLCLLALTALDFIGLEIPILRELVGFLFLTFIPGFLLLRILRLHNLDPVKTVLYSVGLSLSFTMLSGLFINLVYPAFGIQKPLSTFPLLTTLAILTLVLCIACYMRDRSFIHGKFTLFGDLEANPSPNINTLLSLFLIPFLSVFGAYIFNIYDNNTLILILLLVVSILPVLIAFGKIPEELHGLTIFIASISLLYHVSLISWHIWGWDIHVYSYWANLTRDNLYWDPTIPAIRNSLLLATILPTIYSVITNLELVWVFKLCFPFFFSLVPLGIYSICKDEFDSKLIPILAPFTFMFFYPFIETFPFKQLVSELFLVLLIMLIVDRKISSFAKVLMAIIFSFSLIVSHHGVSHFFLLILIFTIFLSFFKFRTESEITKLSFGTLYFVLLISWFMFISGGVRFEAIVILGHNIITSLSEIIQSPPHRSGIKYLTREMPSVLWTAYKFLNIALQMFIALGILKLLVSLIKRERTCRSNDFTALSLGFYGFLASSIIITYGMGFDRAMQITLVVLAPFAVIGCRYIFELVSNGTKLALQLQSATQLNLSLKFFAIFLMIYLLFSSGFTFEVAGEDTPPYCIALNKDNWEHWNAYYQSEVNAIRWLKDYQRNDYNISIINYWNIIKSRNGYLPAEFFPTQKLININPNTATHLCSSYIFFDKYSYVNLKDSYFYSIVLADLDKIYSSGDAKIYLSSK